MSSDNDVNGLRRLDEWRNGERVARDHLAELRRQNRAGRAALLEQAAGLVWCADRYPGEPAWRAYFLAQHEVFALAAQAEEGGDL
jgi:hypothetical protein